MGDFGPPREFVAGAVEGQLQGEGFHYSRLVSALRSPSSPEQLAELLAALTEVAGALASDPHAFPELLDVVFGFSFRGAAPAAAAAFASLVTQLVSANSTLLQPAAQCLVRHLSPALADVRVEPATPEEALAQQQARFAVYERALETLSALLRLVPAGAGVACGVLLEHFPHKRLPAPCLDEYVRNLLVLVRAHPAALRERVLSLVVERLIEVDVEIKLAPDEVEDAELVEMLANGDGGEEVDVMADKLDRMILHVFEYTREEVARGPEACEAVFQLMLRVFEHSTLTTHRSKFTQFLLFFVCQHRASFVEAFVENLISRLLDEQNATVTRLSCAGYLASFVARAKFVTPEVLQSTLAHLLGWAAQYARQRAVAPLDPRDHAGFYAVCQSAFYVMCFHGAALAQTHQSRAFLREFDWPLLVASPLQPLHHVLESVTREFVPVLRHFDLLPHDLLESVAAGVVAPPSSLSSKGRRGVGGLGAGGANPLDSFFPFDPYLLRRSHRFIDDIYCHWRGLDAEAVGDLQLEDVVFADGSSGSESDSESGEEAEEEAEVEAAELMACAGPSFAQLLASSLNDGQGSALDDDSGFGSGGEDGHDPFHLSPSASVVAAADAPMLAAGGAEAYAQQILATKRSHNEIAASGSGSW